MPSALHDSVLEVIVIDDRADFASRARFPGADTPGESAVAIAAEIVKVRRGWRAASLADRRRAGGA